MSNSPEASVHMAERRKRAVEAVVGVGLAAAAVTGLVHEQHAESETKRTQQVEAFKDNTSILDKVIVINAGANLRSTPKIENGSPSDGEPNNIVRTIGKGKVLVVRLPEMNESKYPGWISFAEPDTDFSKIKTVNDRAEHTVWAKYSDLNEQGLVSDTGYQSVSGKTVNEFKQNPLLDQPNTSAYAASMEVDLEQATIASFVITGNLK